MSKLRRYHLDEVKAELEKLPAVVKNIPNSEHIQRVVQLILNDFGNIGYDKQDDVYLLKKIYRFTSNRSRRGVRDLLYPEPGKNREDINALFSIIKRIEYLLDMPELGKKKSMRNEFFESFLGVFIISSIGSTFLFYYLLKTEMPYIYLILVCLGAATLTGTFAVLDSKFSTAYPPKKFNYVSQNEPVRKRAIAYLFLGLLILCGGVLALHKASHIESLKQYYGYVESVSLPYLSYFYTRYYSTKRTKINSKLFCGFRFKVDLFNLFERLKPPKIGRW